MPQVEKFGLRREGCDWWGAEVDVLPYGLVLDFVLSDSALQAWDNNNQQVCFYPRSDAAYNIGPIVEVSKQSLLVCAPSRQCFFLTVASASAAVKSLVPYSDHGLAIL